MASDAIELAHELNQLRALAAKKLVDAPLPIGREAAVRLQDDIRKNSLESHIVELETEITRARETISDKEAARGAADSVFKS